MILKIFKKDLKGLSRNILALAIALGLCLIPSLYAWFNIYSNWDPYATTASVQIAIVSEDEGYSEFIRMINQAGVFRKLKMKP